MLGNLTMSMSMSWNFKKGVGENARRSLLAQVICSGYQRKIFEGFQEDQIDILEIDDTKLDRQWEKLSFGSVSSSLPVRNRRRQTLKVFVLFANIQ